MPRPDPEIFEHATASTCRVADLLLDIGTVLLQSGAHCGRITRNLERIAETWGYEMELFITFTGLMVSIKNARHPDERVARFQRCPHHGVHFGIVTETSILTWQVAEKNIPISEVETRFAKIKTLPHHPRWAILLAVGLACGCLCILAGGNWLNGLVAFTAAFIGLAVRQEVLKLRFNPMIAVIAAAFTTTMIAGIDMTMQLGHSPEKTFATSVLYLIPGVPLINSTIDLIEGRFPTAIARAVFGSFILLCIAVGMSLAILLLGIQNF
ncbi:MAG: threonine/serine ThrE exporter family protein [Verrucomicrobiota bacterium JB025]|nr:threonine/serine exporter family protein [Verrucomicrobiota bacterium JB025]